MTKKQIPETDFRRAIPIGFNISGFMRGSHRIFEILTRSITVSWAVLDPSRLKPLRRSVVV